MRGDDLTRDQARTLKSKLQTMPGYLNRLKHRMIRKGFPPDDPLLASAVRAEDAMRALHVDVHYLECRDVTGRWRERCMGSPAI